MSGEMSDILPRFVTDPDFQWAYCPYCDYSPLFRKHHLNGHRKGYKHTWVCACGMISKEKRLFERKNPEPWYIKRKWRRQGYVGDGHGRIREYGENWSYWATYPISQHLEEVQRNMSIETQLMIRT